MPRFRADGLTLDERAERRLRLGTDVGCDGCGQVVNLGLMTVAGPWAVCWRCVPGVRAALLAAQRGEETAWGGCHPAPRTFDGERAGGYELTPAASIVREWWALGASGEEPREEWIQRALALAGRTRALWTAHGRPAATTGAEQAWEAYLSGGYQPMV